MIQTSFSKNTIKSGMWMLKAPLISIGLCDGPYKVLYATDTRVYYHERDNMTVNHVILANVKYICDTEQEGHTLAALSAKQVKTIAKQVGSIRRKFAGEVERMAMRYETQHADFQG